MIHNIVKETKPDFRSVNTEHTNKKQEQIILSKVSIINPKKQTCLIMEISNMSLGEYLVFLDYTTHYVQPKLYKPSIQDFLAKCPKLVLVSSKFIALNLSAFCENCFSEQLFFIFI